MPFAKVLLADCPTPVQEQLANVLRSGARGDWTCEEVLRYLGMT
jgi:hypothetical protein